jgi:hypothetical protein
MKKQFRTLCVVGALVLLFVVAVQAADSTRLAVNVPFVFSAGGQSLPTGQYIIEIQRLSQGSPLGSCLVVTSQDGKVRHRLVTIPGSVSQLTSGASLVFHKYGDQYFLAGVNSYGLECQVRKSKLEKELAAKLERNTELVSAAAE